MDGVVSAYRLGHRSLGSNFTTPVRKNRDAPTTTTNESAVLVGSSDDSNIHTNQHDTTPAGDTDRDSLDGNISFGGVNPVFVDEEDPIKESTSATSVDDGDLSLNASSPVSITSITQYSDNPSEVVSNTQNSVSDSSPTTHQSDNSGDDSLKIVQSEASKSAPTSPHKTTFITLQLQHSSNISGFSASPWRPKSAPPAPPLETASVPTSSPDTEENKVSPSSETHVSKISLPNLSSMHTAPAHTSTAAPSLPDSLPAPLQPSTPAPSLPSTPISSPPTSPVHLESQTHITEPQQPSSPAPSLPGTPTPSQPDTPINSLPGTPTPSPPLSPKHLPSQPPSPAPSLPGTPAPSQPDTPINSLPGTPTPSPPLSPKHLPSQPPSPAPSIPGTPAPSQPDTPINSLPGTPTPSPPLSPKHLPSQPPSPAPSLPGTPVVSQPSTPVHSPKSSPTPSPTSTPVPFRPSSPISLPPLSTTIPPSTPPPSSERPTLLSQASLSSSFTPPETAPPSWPTPPYSPEDPIPSPPTTPPPAVPQQETKPVEVEEEFIQKQIVKKEYLVLQHGDNDTALTLVVGEPIDTIKDDTMQNLIAMITDGPIDEPAEEAESLIQPVEKETQQCDMMSLPANKPPTFRSNRDSDVDTRQTETSNIPPPRNARHLIGHHSEHSEESSDLETWYISPPANKGGRKSDGTNRSVVDRQPNVWVPYSLDPISKAEFEDLPSIHKTHGELKIKLKTELGEMSNDDSDGSFALKDSISYIEFFRGLLYDDEEVLMNNQYIPFSHAVFNLFDEWLPVANTTTNRNTDKAQVMLMGRVILTNHRLILISAEQQQGAELRKLNLDLGTDKPDGYQIRTIHHDTLHYRSIPLNKFHSVEMQASVGVVKSTNITGNRQSCFSCSCLPGCDFFSKRWQVQETLNTRTNSRLVTCGVILPPWDSRAALQIYMAPSVPLYHVKNFMLELQKNSPGLHPSAVPSFAGY